MSLIFHGLVAWLAHRIPTSRSIQTIALLLSEPRRKPSLVVAPVVALMQWKHEIETHAEGHTVGAIVSAIQCIQGGS